MNSSTHVVSLDDYAVQKFFSQEPAQKSKKSTPPPPPPAPYQPPVYPADALGPLSDVCSVVATDGQVDPALVGQSLLATASLIVQGLYNVETPAGRRPLSLYCLTVAESGDGKSISESVALYAVRKHEKAAHEQYMQALEINNDRKSSEREKLRPPYRISTDSTVQGIIRDLKNGFPAQGCFTDEGAAMLCGWGMSAEQKLNTAGILNRLWGGEAVAVTRGAEGRTQLYNRRFAAHWLIQPDAANTALMDSELANVGFWPRFLIAWPDRIKPREFKKFEYWKTPAVIDYWQRCQKILKTPVDECGNLNTIQLTASAEKPLKKFFERMETSRDPDSPLHEVRAFAVRATEQVCRVSGVLAAFEKHNGGDDEITITDVEIKNAIRLVLFSIDNWLAIFGRREEREQAVLAETLYQWLKKRQNRRASESDMLQTAPRAVRKKSRRDAALAVLKNEGRIQRAVDVLPDGQTRIIQNEWVAI